MLEAQASGLPAIVSDKGGPRELIQDGETGFVTKSKDSNSLYEAMQRLTLDPTLRNQMGQMARTRMNQRTWDKAFELFWIE